MEHRGIKFEIVQGSQSDVWKWSVFVGDPPMLRIGEAPTEQDAAAEVMHVIDRAITIKDNLKMRNQKELD